MLEQFCIINAIDCSGMGQCKTEIITVRHHPTLCRPDNTTHDQTFPFCISILHMIKGWGWEWPGNEAGMTGHQLLNWCPVVQPDALIHNLQGLATLFHNQAVLGCAMGRLQTTCNWAG